MAWLLILLLTQSDAVPSGAPSVDDLMKKLDANPAVKDRDKPFEVAVSLGRLYFGQGRYAEAQLYLQQAATGAEPARAMLKARIKSLPKAELTALPECAPAPEMTLAVATEKARAFKDAPKSVKCLVAALAPLREVEVMLGHTQFLAHDAKGALTTYSRALEIFEDNSDARYARAALTLDIWGDEMPSLRAAQSDFEQFLKEAPNSLKAPAAKRLLARTKEALAAGGLSKLTVTAAQVAEAAPPTPAAGQPPRLSQETMQAFQNAPRTPEMESKFTELVAEGEEHLAHGRFQEALTAYKQVMPYQPNNPRLRAGMAWTMIKLNRQPMANNVWQVATQNPEAIAALGDTLKAKGDAEGAKAVWQRLQESVPEYAPKLQDRK